MMSYEIKMGTAGAYAAEPQNSEKRMDCLRILVIGRSGAVPRICAGLLEAGHIVLSVTELSEAFEALLVQRFDAVLLGRDLESTDITAIAAKVRNLDRDSSSSVRTPVLCLKADSSGMDAHAASQSAIAQSAIDGIVAESLDADALTLAIARLASAVNAHRSVAKTSPLKPELPILEIEALQEQVAYDSELLIELIDLYFSERAKQSAEMAEALAAGDYDRLSRVAHTIKGSLGSLHATAARMTAQALEVAARDRDAVGCQDFLPAFEQQLDLLQAELQRVRESLSAS